jgi:hypothetical protein
MTLVNVETGEVVKPSDDLHRRHLTDGQRAMIAGRMSSRVGAGRPPEKLGDITQLAPSRTAAADLLDVTTTAVGKAKQVLRDGTESLIAAASDGSVPVSTAARVATELTPEAQDAYVENVLSIDPRVQRIEGIDHVRVGRMVAEFKPEKLGVITVSQRDDGTMVVLDGMHRVEVCRQVGCTRSLNAEVFTGATIEEEAGIFLSHNSGKSPSAVSIFLVRVQMGDPVAGDINDIASMHGWTIRNTKAPGYLSAVKALQAVYLNGAGTVTQGANAELTDRVLELLTAAWEHDTGSVHESMLKAVAQLVGRFGPQLDTVKLVAEMQGTRPGILIGKAKTLRDVQGGTVPAALAKILAGMHNKKRRTNLLPEWLEKAGYAHGAEASHHDTPPERGGCWLSALDRSMLREANALFEKRAQHPSRRPR